MRQSSSEKQGRGQIAVFPCGKHSRKSLFTSTAQTAALELRRIFAKAKILQHPRAALGLGE
jgi:hypothetical protein